MDSQIYALLARAEQEKNVDYLRKAYEILDPDLNFHREKSVTCDIDSIGQNLFVECAEKAISFQEYSIANRCLQIYFTLPMIANQFLARAYLCQFELLAPKKTSEMENLEKSIPYLFKAIDFAKQNKRYFFLVYNASITFWKYTRMYIKPNFKQHLVSSLKIITKALKDVDDADYEWRVFLERTLIEAYLDCHQMNEASALAGDLIKFIQNYLPAAFEEFFEFINKKSLLDDEELKSIAASKWNLNAIYLIEKLKKHPKLNKTPSKHDEAADENIVNELEGIYKLVLPPSNTKYPRSQEESAEAEEFVSSSLNLGSKREDAATVNKRHKLMASLANLCLLFDQINLCSQILGYLKESEHLSEELSVEIEFIEYEQAIKELKHKQELFNKSTVKYRIEYVNRCQEQLRNALRLNSPRLIQFGCLTMWNLCLPLLQPGLRSEIRRPLQFVSECLEEIESMECLLRCQIHFELAKCDEEIEQLQTAKQHLKKAIELDDEHIYKEQLEHQLHRLELRGELYKTPERVEDQVAMILEQCVVGNKLGSKDKKVKPAIEDLFKVFVKGEKATGNEINIHSLLLRAGDLLAPNEYTHVLESETFKSDLGKMNEDQVAKLAKKAVNYNACSMKCEKHLAERTGDLERMFNKARQRASNADQAAPSENDLESLLKNDYKERLKLWFDLCKIARKQQIWDICRVSCRFSLLYDNDEYIDRYLRVKPSPGSISRHGSITHSVRAQAKKHPESFGSLFEKELRRNQAQTHFIFGEALIQLIRGEGIELFEKPPEPEQEEPHTNHFTDDSPKESVQKRNLATDPEWLLYCEWLTSLSQEALAHFVKGVEIGVELNESWLVCQGAAYAWNYLHNIIEQKKHHKISQVMSSLTVILDSLRKVGHGSEPELLVFISMALATGLMMPWLPEEQVKQLQIPNVDLKSLTSEPGSISKPPKAAKAALANAAALASSLNKGFSIPSEGNSDMKKALEICDHAMNTTNGENPADLISIRNRFELIKIWVLAKQANQSPIRNMFNSKNHSVERKQDKYTKCLVAIEVLNRNTKVSGSSSYEIKEAPSIRDTIAMIEQVRNWPDKLVELELWSHLAVLASKAGQTENLRNIYSKAMNLISFFEKNKSDKFLYLTSQNLFSETCLALGENLGSLVSSANKQKGEQANSAARVMIRRDALNAFADAAGYAARGENYDYVIHAARHFWNLCLPYLKQAQERATLKENLLEILASLQQAYKFSGKDMPKSKGEGNEADEAQQATEQSKEASKAQSKATNKKATAKEKEDKSGSVKPKRADSKTSKMPPNPGVLESTSAVAVVSTSEPEKPFNPFEDAFDDLTLRCVLYACLFQILIDKEQYDEALEEMEKALNELPRTKHRLLIYRFKVITKSKIGMDVQMDLQKFKEESEKNLAQMYRKVALSSLKHKDTVNSYQRAIEALKSEDSIWLKFEYIIELAQWLYSHEYELIDCIDLCEWAIDLLMFGSRGLEKSRPGSRAVSVANSVVVEKAAKPTAASVRSKRLSLKQQNLTQPVNLLPTIEDDVEAKTLHKEIRSKAEDDFENLMNQPLADQKDDLFSETSFMNKNVQVNDIQDIKQLECLARAHTILAKMIGRPSIEFSDHLLKAYHFAFKILFQAVDTALHSLKEIQKLIAAAAAANEANEKHKKGAPAAAPAAENRRGSAAKKLKPEAGAQGYLPQTVEQWSQFEIHEDILAAWKHSFMAKTGINESTITEPYMLFFYLDVLGQLLREQGLSQFLFPLYNLQLILVNCTFNYKVAENTEMTQARCLSLSSYVRFKLINLCVELNLTQSVLFHQQALLSLALNSSVVKPPVPPAGALDTTALLANMTTQLTLNPATLFKFIQIDPYDVCLVREQIFLQKQRLNQLKDEELSANSVVGGSFEISSNQFKTKRRPTFYLDKGRRSNFVGSSEKLKILAENVDVSLPGERRTLHINLNEMLYKDIWIMMAEELVENGFFQNARDFLHESLNAAISFEDNYTIAKVHYLLAKIALFDCNYLEARNHASSAQKLAIDEEFWYKCIRLIVESHRKDNVDKDSLEKCLKLLNKSLEVVESEKKKRVNKIGQLAYMEAMLVYELAEVTLEGTMEGRLNNDDAHRHPKFHKRSTMHPSIHKHLSNVCMLYSLSIDILTNNGYRREAIGILRSHAKLLKRFANDAKDPKTKHEYYIKCFVVLNDACNIANKLWSEVQSLQPQIELQNVSLPIQRELTELKLEFSGSMVEMLDVYLGEIKEMNDINLQKDYVLKAVENYITSDDDLSEGELEWRTLLVQIPDLVSAMLVSCHTYSQKLKHFKAQTFYLIGKCYRLISQIKYQLKKFNLANARPNENLSIAIAISNWSPSIVELIRVHQQTQIESELSKSKAKQSKNPSVMRTESNAGLLSETGHASSIYGSGAHTVVAGVTIESDHDHIVETSTITNVIDQEYFKNLLLTVHQNEAQAMECLMQALNLAFILDDKKLTSSIVYELIEMVGCYDTPLCAQFIALYQSCVNGMRIEEIIRKSSIDPKNSLITSYLHQLDHFKHSNATSNSLNSPVIKQLLESTRNKFTAFKYLTVNSNHFNFNRDLPTNYLLFIMQLNPQNTEMFATVLDRTKQAPTQTGKNVKVQNTATLPPAKSMVLKIDCDPFELGRLQAKWKEWKSELQAFNLKLEFQINNELLRKDSVSNNSMANSPLDFANNLMRHYINPSSPKYDEVHEDFSALEAKFEYLVEKTEEFFKPLTNFFQSYFNAVILEQQQQSQLMSVKQQQSNTASVKPTDKLILLADIEFFEFPLEALRVFHDCSQFCSMTRDFSLQFFATRYFSHKESVDAQAVGKGDEKGGQKADKGKGQKQVNFAQANSEPLPDNAVVVDHTRFKYLVDVFSEVSPGLPAEFAFASSFKKLIQRYSMFSSKWATIAGNDHISSEGERERLLHEASCFLFHGTERFLSYFNTPTIASSNLNDCKLLIVNDLAQTSKSYSRLGKADVLRNPSELECENALEAAILLSLSGIKCIMANQWTSTVVENCEKLQAIFKESMENRQSVGEIIRFKVSPHVKKIIEDNIKREELKKQQQAEKEKEKKEKKDTKAGSERNKSPSNKKGEKPSELPRTTSGAVQSTEDLSDQPSLVDIEEQKHLELLKSLSQIKKENFNMVCYGLPDVFMSN